MNRIGIYIIFNQHNIPVYVGVDSSINNFKRYKDHYKSKCEFGSWLRDNKHNVIIYAQNMLKNEAHALELDLIRKYQPEFNSKGKRTI